MSHVLDHFIHCQLEPIRPFDPDSNVRKDEESLLGTLLRIPEVIQTRHDATGYIPRLGILQQVELLLRLGRTEGCEHEIVRGLDQG